MQLVLGTYVFANHCTNLLCVVVGIPWVSSFCCQFLMALWNKGFPGLLSWFSLSWPSQLSSIHSHIFLKKWQVRGRGTWLGKNSNLSKFVYMLVNVCIFPQRIWGNYKDLGDIGHLTFEDRNKYFNFNILNIKCIL